MENNVNALLLSLDDEIEKKCCQLQQKKRSHALERLFFAGCAFFIIMPVLLVFFGVNLLPLLIPNLIFLALCVLSLTPLLFRNAFGGTPNEQI